MHIPDVTNMLSEDGTCGPDVGTVSCVCTVVHYAVLEAIRAVYGIWQI